MRTLPPSPPTDPDAQDYCILDEVGYIFSKRGAYSKFSTLLARRHAVDRWHDFESKATERALRDWCELNSIAVAD